VTSILGILRKQGRLPWQAVLDLTRNLDEWRTFGSPREARADARKFYARRLRQNPHAFNGR
jgi:hypothetical protein